VAIAARAIVEGLPDSARGVAKQQPPRAKVGLLLLLAAILRASPGCLVLAAPQLAAAGRLLTAPGRLPHLLWLLAQAEAGSPAAALAGGLRVLLPQLLGVDLAGSGAAAVMDAPAHEPALAYLGGLLAGRPEGSVQLGEAREAVVAPAMVEAASRLGLGAAAAAPEVPRATLERLAQLQPRLSALAAAAGPLQRQHYECWLLAALETAGAAASPPHGAGDAVAAAAAASVLGCLAAEPACYALWEAKHKAQLKGSARVLQHLLHGYSGNAQLRALLRQGRQALALRQLLQALPARHKFHLASGKGWQGSCARAAQDACAGLLARSAAAGRAAEAGARGAAAAAAGRLLAALALAAGVAATAAYHRAEVADVVGRYAGREVAGKLHGGLAAVHAALAPHLDPLLAAAQPHVDAALAAAQPHVDAALAAARPRLAQAAAAAQPYLQQAAEAAQPALAYLQREVLPAVQQAAQRAQDAVHGALAGRQQ
jgi:hypothetical protein